MFSSWGIYNTRLAGSAVFEKLRPAWTQSIHYQEAKALEDKKREEQRRAEEVEMRLASEKARQDAIQEERRLKHLRLEYEAALARGEDVEMPEELKPPKPIEMPVIQTAIEKQEIEIQNNSCGAHDLVFIQI